MCESGIKSISIGWLLNYSTQTAVGKIEVLKIITTTKNNNHVQISKSKWNSSPKTKLVTSEKNRAITAIMTSSNGNIFRVTGPLCGEFTGPRWIPRAKANDAELWCFLWSVMNKRLSKQSWGWWFETPTHPLWRHRNVYWENISYSYTNTSNIQTRLNSSSLFRWLAMKMAFETASFTSGERSVQCGVSSSSSCAKVMSSTWVRVRLLPNW